MLLKKPFILFLFIAAFPCFSGMLINDKFGGIDVGTGLYPKNNDSKYSNYQYCEVLKFTNLQVTINCEIATRVKGAPLTKKETFILPPQDLPRFFTKK